MAAATCNKKAREKMGEMLKSGTDLFLVASPRAPVPNGNKMDIFFARKFHLIKINII